MRAATQQRPQETPIAPGHRRDHVHGGIPQTNGEDLRVRRHAQQGMAERENPATVGGGAFREEDDGPVGVFLQECGDVD